MMKKSLMNPNYEASYSNGFDPQEDFSQFLMETRRHGREAKLKRSSVHPLESGNKGTEKERKGKKSWKNSLISWWKADKKSKLRMGPTNSSPSKVSEKRQQGHVSGPIYNRGKGSDGKHWRQTSRPLKSLLFKPTKREENEIPYMSLHQQNSTRAVQNYGPLYMVT